MDNEPNNTIIKEDLIECDVCGSVDLCLTREFIHSFTWIKCRQCDEVFGLAEKTKNIMGVDYVVSN